MMIQWANSMEKTTGDHLSNKHTWLRALFMLIFYLVLYLTRFILLLIALFQLVSMLFTGQVNLPLKRFGQGLSNYAYHIYCYLTFNTQTRPYPFSEWPTEPVKQLPKPENAHGN